MPAIKVHHTDTVDGAWDGPGMKANLRIGENESYYRKAFAWQDPEADSSTKVAYRFVHHEVSSDGSIGAANIEGCVTGVGVLNGGMGGTTIPDADRQGVWDHLAAHIKDAGATPPELKSTEPAELERRSVNVELRASTRHYTNTPVIEGVAAVYDQEATITGWGGGFRETIKPGAFKRVLSENPDVVAALNHNWDMILGRTTAGTLILEDSADGLKYSVDINPNDPEALGVYAKVQRGDIRQSSFAFTVRTDQFTNPPEGSKELPLRTIVEIDQLFDVSPVTFPAYPQTSASVRSKLEALRHPTQKVKAQAAAEAAAEPDPGIAARQKARRRALEIAERVKVSTKNH